MIQQPGKPISCSLGPANQGAVGRPAHYQWKSSPEVASSSPQADKHISGCLYLHKAIKLHLYSYQCFPFIPPSIDKTGRHLLFLYTQNLPLLEQFSIKYAICKRITNSQKIGCTQKFQFLFKLDDLLWNKLRGLQEIIKYCRFSSVFKIFIILKQK